MIGCIYTRRRLCPLGAASRSLKPEAAKPDDEEANNKGDNGGGPPAPTSEEYDSTPASNMAPCLRMSSLLSWAIAYIGATDAQVLCLLLSGAYSAKPTLQWAAALSSAELATRLGRTLMLLSWYMGPLCSCRICG
jgi:hypothetical protein